MNVGDKVSHSKLGVGTVTKVVTFYGRTGVLQVDFGFTEELIPTDEVDLIEGTATVRSEVSQPESEDKLPPKKRLAPSAMLDETVAARKGIIALRLGQILESHVSQISVGTKGVEQVLRASLKQAANQQPDMVMVEGAWGGGKTHLLTLLSALAREEKFATASVVMDGVGVTLSDPMQLMESITSTIRFPEERMSGGLAAHLMKANVSKLRVRGARMLADALEQVPKQALQDSEVLHVLEDYFGLSLAASPANEKLRKLGWRIRLPALKARYVGDRAERFCELIRNWAQFSVTMGARGLVVVLDEIDVEYATTAWWDRGSRTKRERRRSFVKELGKLRECKVPLLVAFASAPASADVEVENDAVRDIESAIGGLDYHIKVPKPSEEDLRELGNNVMDLYEQAYHGSFGGLDDRQRRALLDKLVNDYKKSISPVPRLFVRTMLESLDIRAD